MASPKDIVETVSEKMGVSLGTVINHDRNLSVAGLRNAGSRGRGKSSATAIDAANLIIAVAASRNVKDSVATVDAYAGLVCDDPMEITDQNGIRAVRGRTFIDAIAALLEHLPAWREEFSHSQDAFIEVRLFGPHPTAKIEMNKDGILHNFSYRQQYLMGKRTEITFADLTYSSSFTQVTLGFIGEKLLS